MVFCHTDNNFIARLQTRTGITYATMLMDSVVPARPDDIFCHPMHSVIVPLFPRSFVTRGQALGFGKAGCDGRFRRSGYKTVG